MKPISPVIPGYEKFEVTFAEDQPEYLPLPALVSLTNDPDEIKVTTRWKLSEEEKSLISQGGDVILTTMTFGHPFQPVTLEVIPGVE
jgi:hypothetical protein